jgi:hypothetical protein
MHLGEINSYTEVAYLPELNQTKFNIGNYQFDINENGQTNY